MDNELGLGSDARQRVFHTTVFGDSAAEIEVAALTAAQEFFGDGVPLEVVHDYMASRATPSDGTDKKYAAGVSVRALA